MTRRDELQEAVLRGEPLPLEVIDLHCHLGPYYRFFTPRLDADEMLAVMDRVGVSLAALVPNESLSAGPEPSAVNVAAAAVKAHPGRFLGYAVANPNYPALVEAELARSFDMHGFRLIKIHPSLHQCPMTHAAYRAVYDFAREHGAPILTHTWARDPHCSPEIAAEVARGYPEVTFLWGHSGGSDVRDAARLAAELDNVYLDLASSMVFAGQIEFMLRVAGPEKVTFGSDFTFISLPQQVGKVVFAHIDADSKRKILHDNAARILATAGITTP